MNYAKQNNNRTIEFYYEVIWKNYFKVALYSISYTGI